MKNRRFLSRFLIVLIAALLAPVLQLRGQQDEITIARRMKMFIADFESPAPAGALFAGSALADAVEQQALTSQKILGNIIIIPRSTRSAGSLTGFSIDDIRSILVLEQPLGVEAVMAGKVTKISNGNFDILLQIVDVQKKNIPTSRRILNYAEAKDVPPTAEGFEAAVRALVATLETGNFPRVDIVTPNFDVISILQIDKDNFPEMKLSVSVVNSHGDPVSIMPELFEIRENGNMVIADIHKIKTGETVTTPVTLLLAIDRSPSMLEETDGRQTGEPFRRAKAAALEFINRLSPMDRIRVVAFDQEVLPLGGYTNDKAYYTSRLDALKAGVGTGLYNVLRYCVQDMTNIKGEKAVILLTDGRNDVRGAPEYVKNATLDEGVSLAQKLAIPVYTIGFGAADEKVLTEVAQKTHSVFFKAAGSERLRELYLQLHRIIENQYIITYRSLANRSGTVSVSLNIKEDQRQFTLTAEEQKKADRLIKDNENRQESSKADLQRKEIETTQQEVNRQKQEIDQRKNELALLETDLKEKEKSLSLTNQRLEERRSDIAELERRINQRKKELDDREARLKADSLRLEQQKMEILQIEENIRQADSEILDFLKIKLDYIRQQKDRLDQMKTSTDKTQ